MHHRRMCVRIHEKQLIYFVGLDEESLYLYRNSGSCWSDNKRNRDTLRGPPERHQCHGHVSYLRARWPLALPAAGSSPADPH